MTSSRYFYYSDMEQQRQRKKREEEEEERRRSANDDPHLLQSLKGGHRNNAITALAFAPRSNRYIFSASDGDGSIMFWHVSSSVTSVGSKNRKRPVRFLGHEKDVLALAHTEREGEGGRVASAGLDRSVRVWKATACVFIFFVSFVCFSFARFDFFSSKTKDGGGARETLLLLTTTTTTTTTGKESLWF